MPLSREERNRRKQIKRKAGMYKYNTRPLGEISCLRYTPKSTEQLSQLSVVPINTLCTNVTAADADGAPADLEFGINVSRIEDDNCFALKSLTRSDNMMLDVLINSSNQELVIADSQRYVSLPN
jgi:hypothetical protein